MIPFKLLWFIVLTDKVGVFKDRNKTLCNLNTPTVFHLRLLTDT